MDLKELCNALQLIKGELTIRHENEGVFKVFLKNADGDCQTTFTSLAMENSLVDVPEIVFNGMLSELFQKQKK